MFCSSIRRYFPTVTRLLYLLRLTGRNRDALWFKLEPRLDLPYKGALACALVLVLFSFLFFHFLCRFPQFDLDLDRYASRRLRELQRLGKVQTPNIDRLAKGGVNFRRAFSPVPITLPAHASILTALYPPKHGVEQRHLCAGTGTY